MPLWVSSIIKAVKTTVIKDVSMFRKGFLMSVGLALSVAVVAAQSETCPPLIQTALEQVGDSCGSLARNTACYGNISLQAEALPDVSDFTFVDVGDTVNVSDLNMLKTSPLNEEENTWGVAVLSVQANLPDTLPGQNVTMMVYGDSTLETQISIRLNVGSNQAVNIRKAPSTAGEVIGQLTSGELIQADGRLEDNSWVRVVLVDGLLGWVNTSVATVEGDIASLPAVTADEQEFASSQSAFYFTSGIGKSACAELPSGGLMLQSPEGTEVELLINDVNIQIGSTIAVRFLDRVPSAQPDEPIIPHLAFYVLEGAIKNVALTGDAARPVSLPTVQQGLVLYIPVDETTGLPNGQDPLVKPYDGDDIEIFGELASALPIAITPAAPMSEEDFATLQTIDIQAGAWTFVPSNQPVMCLDNGEAQSIALLPVVSQMLSGNIRVLGVGETVESVDATGQAASLTGETEGEIIVLESSMPTPYTLTRTSPDIYTGTSGFGDLAIKLASPTQGILRAVTPIITPDGTELCAQAELFLIGTTGQ